MCTGMKRAVFAGVLAGGLLLGITGCGEAKPAAEEPPATVKPKEHPAEGTPATSKPKDHPAH